MAAGLTLEGSPAKAPKLIIGSRKSAVKSKHGGAVIVIDGAHKSRAAAVALFVALGGSQADARKACFECLLAPGESRSAREVYCCSPRAPGHGRGGTCHRVPAGWWDRRREADVAPDFRPPAAPSSGAAGANPERA